MKGIPNITVPRLSALTLWIGLSVLFALGCATTVVDLMKLPAQEQARASKARQHVLIDPGSGEVLMSAPEKSDTPAETFDVGTKEETATPPAAPETSEPAKTEPTSTEGPPATTAPPTSAATPSAVAGMPTLQTTPAKVAIETPAHTKDSLVSAPAREVTETIGTLQLPRRGDKDVTPASLYGRPFKRKPEQVPISFIVTDMGLDPQSIGAILSLPPEISAAYSAYTKKESAFSESLRAAGHEVWTMLPTMTDRYPSDDPGPMGIVGQMPDEEVVRRLQEILARVPGSVGLVLPPNESISTQKGALAPVLKEVSARGIYLLTTNPTRSLDPFTADKSLKEVVHRANLVLDPEPDETQIRSRLSGISAAAKEKGQYLVVVSSRPQTLRILAEWLKENPLKEPFALAPASAFYQAKAAPEEAAPKEEAGGHGGGHGGGEKKEEKKKQPKEKPKKPLPQDQYLKPAGDKKEGGGHGGGH